MRVQKIAVIVCPDRRADLHPFQCRQNNHQILIQKRGSITEKTIKDTGEDTGNYQKKEYLSVVILIGQICDYIFKHHLPVHLEKRKTR
jgi:hypothetical protein